MKIGEIFNIHQGHQITDEEIYNSKGGTIPIFSGNNEIKGYWGESIINSSCLPCLTYATKAFAGTITIQTEIFDANNTACLWLKDEYKENYEIEWFKYILPKYFLENVTSKEGVSYLNKEIVLNIDIDIPNKSEQNRQILVYRKIELLKNRIMESNKEFSKILRKSVIISNDQNKQIYLNSVINYVSRNDSLSEEGLYNLNTQDKSVIVLSGNSNDEIYGRVDPYQKNIHYLLDKQGIRLISRGNAGQITYLKRGNYATNTNAFLLYLLDNFKLTHKIDTEEKERNYLKFLCLYLQPIFYSEASNSDLAVFPLTNVMKTMKILDFEYSPEIEKYAFMYDKIQTLRSCLNAIQETLNELKNKYIV